MTGRPGVVAGVTHVAECLGHLFGHSREHALAAAEAKQRVACLGRDGDQQAVDESIVEVTDVVVTLMFPKFVWDLLVVDDAVAQLA